MARWLNDALSSEPNWSVGFVGCHGAIAEALDSVAHLVDDGGTMLNLLLCYHVVEIVIFGVIVVKNIGGFVGLGVEIVTHGGTSAFNGATFGID